MSRKSKIGIIIFVLLISISTFYYLLIYSPKKELQQISSNFETILREKNFSNLQTVVLKDSFINTEAATGAELIDKFEQGIYIKDAHYANLPTFPKKKYGDVIVGSAIMKAKIDSKERCCFKLVAVKEQGQWKIASFYFPDLLDY